MSKLRSLLILALTSLACSRIVFALFDDPEGPNLLVVTVLAAIIYLVSLGFYLPKIFPTLSGFRRTLATIVLQIGVATGFYCLGLL